MLLNTRLAMADHRSFSWTAGVIIVSQAAVG
jgi:hypothetical protein